MRNKLKFILPCIIFFFGASFVSAQKGNVGFGTNSPHPSAMVHIDDNHSMGFKIPYTDTNAVTAYANSFTPPIPIANGLLIYQKGAETFYYYDAPKNIWIPLNGVTGPTGPVGDTGLAGPTGPVNINGQFRYGTGNPVKITSDTCNRYYIDIVNAHVYRYTCPIGLWLRVGGPYSNTVKGGKTNIKSSEKLQEIVEPGSSSAVVFTRVDNLADTIDVPFGYTGYIFVKAYGAVRKKTPNNDYNYAKFRFRFNAVDLGNTETVVSMGPNGNAPNQIADNVSWSLSYATEITSKTIVQVMGAQLFSHQLNGSIILTDGPGKPNTAHMEIMVVYRRQ